MKAFENTLWDRWELVIAGLKSAIMPIDLVVINIEGGNHDNYLAAIEQARGRKDVVVTCSIPDGELIRYPFLDVEYRILAGDDKIKVTGEPDNVQKVLNPNPKGK